MPDDLTHPLELQVVMPVYNEQSAMGSVIDQWCARLDACGMRYSIMAVDDGSTDQTAAALQALRDKWGPKLEVVRQKNGGHGQAILNGYRRAIEQKPTWIFQIDSDGQCDPQYFAQLWEARDGYDFVCGYRARRDDGFSRKIISTVLRVVVFLVSGAWCKDANVPYRLMRTAAIAPLIPQIPPTSFFTNVCLTVLVTRARLKTRFFPITFRVRHSGETTVPLSKLGKNALTLVRNLQELLKSSS
jgi:glycosyltransferase involved in cell wall biosynthesis